MVYNSKVNLSFVLALLIRSTSQQLKYIACSDRTGEAPDGYFGFHIIEENLAEATVKILDNLARRILVGTFAALPTLSKTCPGLNTCGV